MRIFYEKFEHIHFTECFIESISIGENLTEIVIEKGLVLLRNHPAFSIYGCKYPRAILRWRFVHEYFLRTSPYKGDPKQGKFEIPHVESALFSGKTDQSRNYELEGILIKSPAWCDLSINAHHFELILPEY